jgi:hypothetical protein
VRLQLHALAYNLANFMRTLALPASVKHWSLSSLRDKLVKIGAKIVTHSRYVTFQMTHLRIGAADESFAREAWVVTAPEAARMDVRFSGWRVSTTGGKRQQRRAAQGPAAAKRPAR